MVTYPTTTTTADEILNTVAAEVGLDEVSDPVGSADPSYKQLTRLLNVAGDELAVMHNWEVLRREHTITTAADDTGNYALPTDFGYIVDNTVWDRTEDEPMAGPLSAYDWQALLGLTTTSIYTLGWRIMDGEFYIFPYNPVGYVRNIYFEYMSNSWLIATDGTTYKNKVTVNSDVILYNRILISRYTKLKFLLARGLDATAAQDDFNQIFELLSGQDEGAGILSAGTSGRGVTYLDPYRNIGNSSFGG